MELNHCVNGVWFYDPSLPNHIVCQDDIAPMPSKKTMKEIESIMANSEAIKKRCYMLDIPSHLQFGMKHDTKGL